VDKVLAWSVGESYHAEAEADLSQSDSYRAATRTRPLTFIGKIVFCSTVLTVRSSRKGSDHFAPHQLDLP
jgi:hypothetical protein